MYPELLFAVRRNVADLQFIPKELQTPKLCLVAIIHDYGILDLINPELRT